MAQQFNGDVAVDGKLTTKDMELTSNMLVNSINISAEELSYLDGASSNLQSQINNKADKSTTLSGYGITDAYTKNEIDSKLAVFEKVDIVYDKNSSSSSVNWGYTSGIRSQVTVSGKSFSKYKHLRIMYASKTVSDAQDSFGGNNIILLDLKTSSILGVYTCTVMNRYARMELQYNAGIIITVNSAKSSVSVTFGDGGNTIPSSNTEYYIFKIEGVY